MQISGRVGPPCTPVRGKANNQIISISALLMQGASETSSPKDQDLEELIIKPLKMDDISRAVKSDPLILKFVQVQLEKLGKQWAAEVRSKLRIIGRTKLELRNASARLEAHGPYRSPELLI